MFGRAAIRLGIGPHSSYIYICSFITTFRSAIILYSTRTWDIKHINQSTSVTTGAGFWNGMVKRVKLRQHAKFCGDRSNCRQDMAIFRFSKMAAAAILDFLHLQIFNSRTAQEGWSASPCQIWSKSVQTIAEMAILWFFKDGGRPPFWIYHAHVWTTHKGNLVIFIAVQNLVGISTVVLTICMFFDFASLAWKRLSAPPKWGFEGFEPLHGELYQRNPKKAHPCASPHRLSHHVRKSLNASDL